jgi:hypothetical protein
LLYGLIQPNFVAVLSENGGYCMKEYFRFLRVMLLSVLVVLGAAVLMAQAPKQRSGAELKALFQAHQADFDYLLGDWEFTSVSKKWGKGQGVWSAVRIAEGAQILDEYRALSPDGKETYYASSTIRSYNAVLDQWELISAEHGTGLHNFGTAQRVGDEMHIEQNFAVMSDKPTISRIRYYNIKPDSFSWTSDLSLDGGKTWEKDYLKIEAHRIGPARFLGQLAPAKNLTVK